LNIQGLVSELHDIGYDLNLEGKNIRFAYARKGIPPEKATSLLSEVRLHKLEIIEFLKKELFLLIGQTFIEINQHWEPGALEWMKRTRANDFKKMVALEEQINQLALSGNVNTLNEVLKSYTGLTVGAARTFKTQRGETGDLFQRGTGDR
jgi:hypothetical protein